MSNMYTCIAYLIQIRKFCSKNLVHKIVKSRHRATERAGKFTIAHCARSPGSGVGYLGGLVLDFPKKFDFDKLNM